jgi:hypothetical protein
MDKKTVTLLRLMQNDAHVVNRFWSYVDKGDDGESCWTWRGRLTPSGYPCFSVGQYSVAPTRIAWYIATGELPIGGRVYHLCKNECCLRPDHLGWALGRVAERVLNGQEAGYVGLSGTPLALGMRRTGKTERIIRLTGAPPRERAG